MGADVARVPFERAERQALRPLNGARRDLSPTLQTDTYADLDTNPYSVPWRLIAAEVGV
jgi:hypothetical protein